MTGPDRDDLKFFLILAAIIVATIWCLVPFLFRLTDYVLLN